MDRSSRNNKLQNALFEVETKENDLAFKKPVCPIEDLINIILSDEPFEKTTQDIFYGIRCLFPFFLSPACSKIYNLSILKKTLRNSNYVTKIKIFDYKQQNLKSFYMLKKDANVSYKIEDVIGQNQSLNEFTKVSKDKFLKMLQREAKIKSYSSNSLGNNSRLLESKYKLSSFKSKSIEASRFTQVIEKVQNNIKLSSIPKKTQVLNPSGNFSSYRKQGTESGSFEKQKRSVNVPQDKSLKKIDKDGVPISNPDNNSLMIGRVKSRKKSKPSSILKKNNQAVNDTKSQLDTFNPEENVGEVSNPFESYQDANESKIRKFSNQNLNIIQQWINDNVNINSVLESDYLEVNEETTSQRLGEQNQITNIINQELNCYPNIPYRITVPPGYEIPFGVATGNIRSNENDITKRSGHWPTPLRVDSEKKVNSNDRFLVSGVEETSNTAVEPDQLPSMHDVTSSIVSSYLPIPFSGSFNSNCTNSLELANGKRKSPNEMTSGSSSSSLISKPSENGKRLKDASFMPGQSSLNDALVDIIDSRAQPRVTSNEKSCVQLNMPLNGSFSLPLSDCDETMLSEFNLIPNEFVKNLNHSPSICAGNIRETCLKKKSVSGKKSRTETSLKHKIEKLGYKKKKKNVMEKNEILPILKEGKIFNLLPPVMKALDMPTIYNESGDGCNSSVVELSIPKFINDYKKLNFVKGRDLKSVQSENFSKTGESIAEAQLKDKQQDTFKNFLCQELPAEHLEASDKNCTIPSNDINISSDAEKFISKGSMKNQSLDISQPHLSVAAVAMVPPVVISESFTDIEHLLEQLNNNDSELSKRLSVIYPEYLPAKNSVDCGSCNCENTACPDDENCPTHQRESVEKSTLNNVMKLDPSRCQIKEIQHPPFDEHAEHPSLSINVKDLEKDILNLHVKRIRELHPWMRYEETSHSFSCQDCSYEVGDSSCEMGSVKVIHCVKQLRLKAFYDLCKKHSHSHFHCISVILKKNPRRFNAIKFLLMNCLPNFVSLDELIKDIICIFKENGNHEWRGAIINLIELVRSLNERRMLFVVRQLNLPVSFILDFCKNIAIMRFVLPTGEPIEYVLVIGNCHLKTVHFFLQTISISAANVIFFKVLDKCGCCSNCDFTSSKEVGSLLPIRFPLGKELLLLIQRDNRLGNLFKFSKGIFQLYDEFPKNFREIEGSYILQNYQSCLWPALEYTFKEREKLKEVCHDIFVKYGNIIALGLSKYPIPLVDEIKNCMDEIKSTFVQVRSIAKRCEEDSSFIHQLPSIFQSLSDKVSNCCDVDESIKWNLSNFVIENSRNVCWGGREHISDFEFLKYPSTLMALNCCPKSIENFEKIYYLAKPFVKEESQKVLEDLQSFGKFLFETFDTYCMPLNDIIKVFYTHVFAKQNFPLSHTLYCVVGTLPFFPAYVERSIYYTRNICLKFTEKFGKGVGFNLAIIYFQQQELPHLKSNLAAYCLQSLTRNGKGPDKMKNSNFLKF